MATAPRERHGTGAIVVAAILIVAGVCALIGNLVGDQIGGELVVLGIGLVFLTAYAATRRYGFLVPGGIVSGVGAGIVLADAMGRTDNGAIVVVASGLGFLAIYFVDLLVTRQGERWWPVIPGGLMMLAGAATESNATWGAQVAQIGAPVLLIVLGLILLVTRGRTAGGQR
jgi:hypothetical protein